MIAVQGKNNNPELEGNKHEGPNDYIMMRERKASMANMKDSKSPDQGA